MSLSLATRGYICNRFTVAVDSNMKPSINMVQEKPSVLTRDTAPLKFKIPDTFKEKNTGKK